MKLGSHPSFVVAAERTLTETLQGRAKFDTFISLCRAGTIEGSTNLHNIPNVAKVGLGIYPTKIFLDKPDWEFKEWTDWKHSDNKSFLKRMIKLFAEDGYTILLRLIGHTHEEACKLIRRFFRDSVAEQVIEEMRGSKTTLKRLFPQMKCPNCAECEFKGKECDDAE